MVLGAQPGDAFVTGEDESAACEYPFVNVAFARVRARTQR